MFLKHTCCLIGLSQLLDGFFLKLVRGTIKSIDRIKTFGQDIDLGRIQTQCESNGGIFFVKKHGEIGMVEADAGAMEYGVTSL